LNTIPDETHHNYTVQWSGISVSCVAIYLKLALKFHTSIQSYPIPLTYHEILVLYTSINPHTDEFGCIVKLGHKCFRHEYYRMFKYLSVEYLNILLEMLHAIQGLINTFVCPSTVSEKLGLTSGTVFVFINILFRCSLFFSPWCQRVIACVHIVYGTIGLSHVLYVSDASSGWY